LLGSEKIFDGLPLSTYGPVVVQGKRAFWSGVTARGQHIDKAGEVLYADCGDTGGVHDKA